ncbi:aldo-keto reductase [Blastomyces dermatitidis ER-3]|uniref:Aldo-keto reductase n=1 Tax=Ajellomyces dermatitidis (strain ER-3 / ATCC MYA-2586) TaxID=559297 RepID=A0ABP2F4F5_AJEDR|nr:aldo-keto reductase [Blastomyces dermatitidis ER-3]EEQ91840.2 aldo-keto reductase [Blastomyces dermatitidis ER-3]
MLKPSTGKMASVSRWEKLLLRPALSSATATLPAPTAIPIFVYGTAWKKDQTADLVYQALSAGFKGVDTAAQPKHYREDLVGEGLRRALAEGKVKREDLYVQTKYTPIGGQDPHSVPYDPSSPIAAQIHSSVKSSLANLRSREDTSSETDTYLDALVLHSPLPTINETLEAWAALEEYVPHKIRNLGISNCDLRVLKAIHSSTKVKPAVVQNRFYPGSKFDVDLRQFCRQNSIVYQSFWTLTANPELVWSTEVGLLSQQARISPQAALYCLVLGLGDTVMLNGTKNEGRMLADLAAPKAVEEFSSKYPEQWDRILGRFKKKIGETE